MPLGKFREIHLHLHPLLDQIRIILWHLHVYAQATVVHHPEQGATVVAARGDQFADLRIPFGHHPVKRRHDALERLLGQQTLQVGARGIHGILPRLGIRLLFIGLLPGYRVRR